MLTIKIDNKKIEDIFLNEFHSNKEKFIEFIENSFYNFKKQDSKNTSDFSYLNSEIDKGLNSPISSKSHKEIFKELKSKYV